MIQNDRRSSNSADQVTQNVKKGELPGDSVNSYLLGTADLFPHPFSVFSAIAPCTTTIPHAIMFSIQFYTYETRPITSIQPSQIRSSEAPPTLSTQFSTPTLQPQFFEFSDNFTLLTHKVNWAYGTDLESEDSGWLELDPLYRMLFLALFRQTQRIWTIWAT